MIKKIEGSIAIAKILNKFKIYIDALIVNKWQILLAGKFCLQGGRWFGIILLHIISM